MFRFNIRPPPKPPVSRTIDMLSNRQTLISAYRSFDILTAVFSFALAGWVTHSIQNGDLSIYAYLDMRMKAQNVGLFLLFIYLWQFIFLESALYRSRRLSTRREEVYDLLKATSKGTLLLCIASLAFNITMITPLFILLFWASTSLICLSGRLFLRRLLEWLRLRGRNIRNMLIVGTNERAVRLCRNIESRPELGYRLLGYVDGDWRGNGVFQKTGYPIISDFENFPAFLRANAVDEVILCLPVKSFYDQICSISHTCEEQGILVRYLTNLFDTKLARVKADHIEGEPVICQYTGSIEGWQAGIKRLCDIVFSSMLLLGLSPLLLLIALVVKITSPGPVLFVQERIGLNKRRFPCYKFRSMVSDAENRQAALESLNEVSGPVFKIENDPRITDIGRILRKTSMDELPQLINVLKGEMSLVGPRALPVRDYNGFREDWHRRRFSVRPGITGLWQVSGRSSVSFERWMELDMRYIDQWSLWLDARILAQTIPAVLRGTGAC